MAGAFRRLLGLAAGLALLAGAAAAQTVAPARPDDRTVGSVQAPVTLTVYLSTTCGHCAHWHQRDFPAIKARYVDSGQVRVVFRDLFTPPAQLALYGAAMARCAPPDRYEAALGALFAGQAAMRAAGASEPAAIAWLQRAGAAGGLTPQQMQACTRDEAALDALVARNDQSVADGVASTPTFMINGRKVLEDFQTHDVAAFALVLDPLLAGG